MEKTVQSLTSNVEAWEKRGMPSTAALSNGLSTDPRSCTALWGGLHEYSTFADAAKYAIHRL